MLFFCNGWSVNKLFIYLFIYKLLFFFSGKKRRVRKEACETVNMVNLC